MDAIKLKFSCAGSGQGRSRWHENGSCVDSAWSVPPETVVVSHVPGQKSSRSLAEILRRERQHRSPPLLPNNLMGVTAVRTEWPVSAAQRRTPLPSPRGASHGKTPATSCHTPMVTHQRQHDDEATTNRIRAASFNSIDRSIDSVERKSRSESDGGQVRVLRRRGPHGEEAAAAKRPLLSSPLLSNPPCIITHRAVNET